LSRRIDKYPVRVSYWKDHQDNILLTVSSSPDFARKLFSSSMEKGTGVSNEAPGITGASKIEKSF
jgi:hypothetical protein